MAATMPPASRLRIVCAHLPGPIVIESTHPYPTIANSLLMAPVLTPAMLLEALHCALHTTRVSPSEWLVTPHDKRARVLAACTRRIGHGGGQVAWIDFLEDSVIFAGLTRDPGAPRHANPAGSLVDEYTWALLVEQKNC
ncbi:hypothetical protein AURDEDRAFT_112528 [Auricularia subglabra TFB-10046 SS5]|nr:hypothetical protein AURDEDRAFT_112528 [Auricularia subglabra TFB-10046 SS5]